MVSVVRILACISFEMYDTRAIFPAVHHPPIMIRSTPRIIEFTAASFLLKENSIAVTNIHTNVRVTRA